MYSLMRSMLSFADSENISLCRQPNAQLVAREPGFDVDGAALCVDAIDFRRDLLAKFCLDFLEPYLARL